MNSWVVKLFGLNARNISRMKTFALAGVVDNRKSVLERCVSSYRDSSLCWAQSNIVVQKQFSTSIQPEGSCCDQGNLLTNLEIALRESDYVAAWKVFNQFKSSYGFPAPSLVCKLITVLTYSSDRRSLQKASDLVLKIAKEKSELLQRDTLSRLCFALGRAQMFVPASKILRLMLQKDNAPTMDVLCSVFMHMVKTEAGANLASNILLELCESFRNLRAKRSECAMSLKPSTQIFNMVLDSCVRFGSSLKGQRIIEVMAETGVVADAHSVVLFTCIYEMNGQRDELKKLKGYVDRVSVPFARHYGQFYDKLLSLHYKFDDLDAASSLVEDLYFLWGSRSQQENKDLASPCMVPIGSPYLKEGLKIQVMFESLQKDYLFLVEGKEDFVIVRNGRLSLNSKGLAQLIIRYKKIQRIAEFSKLIAAIEKEIDASEEGSLCCDVIHACIYTGWLETAHDIVDDMEMCQIPIPTTTYMLLLNAYCREKMAKEAEALAKQIRRTGLHLDETDEMIVSQCLSGVACENSQSLLPPATIRQSELIDCLLLEMKREDNDPSKVLEINASIYFFCKAKMMDDARKSYRKLQMLNIQPTVQTFAYLIHGYSSLKMYREITILWGDIKRYMNHGCSLANRDLYESLVMNFLQGGYFERVMEVISHMKERSMYPDRWMYKNEFVRVHKNLYRRLKATDVKNEAQKLRLEHVTAFRKWVRNK